MEINPSGPAPRIGPKPGPTPRPNRRPGLPPVDTHATLEEETGGPEDDPEQLKAEEYDEEPESASDVEDLDDGISDRFSGPDWEDEPSTAPTDETDAESPRSSSALYPAITFYPQPDGSVGYVISEFQGQWERLDALARFLVKALADLPLDDWPSFGDVRRGRKNKFEQRKFIEDMLGEDPRATKARISEWLQYSVLSANGQYLRASAFFRDNVGTTAAGRERALLLLRRTPRREALPIAARRHEVSKALQAEFGAARSTVEGWIKWAEQQGPELETEQ